MENYTKFKSEVKFGDELKTYEITTDKWDCNVEDIHYLLRSLVLAMGFHPNNVDEIFGDNMEEPEATD